MKTIKMVRGTATNGLLYATGPIAKEDGTLPYRYVICEWGCNQYQVATETFGSDLFNYHEESDLFIFNSHLSSGTYVIGLENALLAFIARLSFAMSKAA